MRLSSSVRAGCAGAILVALASCGGGGGGGGDQPPPAVSSNPGAPPSNSAPTAPTPAPPAPSAASKGGHQAKAILAFSDVGLAIRENGELWGWGNGSLCLHGQGNKTDLLSPARLGTEFTKFGGNVVNGNAVLAFKGTDLYGWGQDGRALGQNTSTEVCSPVLILQGVVDVSIRSTGGAAVMVDGSVFRWGHMIQDPTARVGLTRLLDITNPTLAFGAEGRWISVADSADGHVALINSAGELYTFTAGSGPAWEALLGIGVTNLPMGSASYAKPLMVRVGTQSNWTKVYNGGSSGKYYATNSVGELWGWGRNGTASAGALGDGTTATQASPVRILPAGPEIIKFSVSDRPNFRSVVRADGSVVAWGENYNNAFGNGTEVASVTPISVATDSRDFAFNGMTGISIKSNGDIWTWGRNFPTRNNGLNRADAESQSPGIQGNLSPAVSDSFR